MLTVRDVLSLPEFQPAKLTAGESGLDREVRWAHTLDMPDIVNWARPGEFLLTNALGLSIEPELQKTLIPHLYNAGVASLAISIGKYFREVPDFMRTQADQLGFPLITLPWELPFYDFTRAIMERVINDKYAILQESLNVHNRLMEIVLKGTGLDDLARTLAELVECSVSIEDSNFHLLSYANWGEVDEARLESILYGHTLPIHLEEMKSAGIFDTLKRVRRPIRVSPIPHIGLRYERVVAPIVAAGEILGYVWLIPHGRLTDEFDIVAVERAATVAAIIMMRDRAVYEAQQRLKTDFFKRIMKSNFSTERELKEEALSFGISLENEQQIILLQGGRGDTSLPLLQRATQEAVSALSKSALVLEWEGKIVVLLGVKDTSEGFAVAREIWEELGRRDASAYVAVSNACPDIRVLYKCYQEAKEALEFSIDCVGVPMPVFFDDMGSFHWLKSLPEEIIRENKYYRMVEKVAEYDSGHNTDILKTLFVYLELGGNATRASRYLIIHRNTLRQRIERASEIMGVDVNVPRHSFELHVALRTFMLRTGKGCLSALRNGKMIDRRRESLSE